MSANSLFFTDLSTTKTRSHTESQILFFDRFVSMLRRHGRFGTTRFSTKNNNGILMTKLSIGILFPAHRAYPKTYLCNNVVTARNITYLIEYRSAAIDDHFFGPVVFLSTHRPYTNRRSIHVVPAARRENVLCVDRKIFGASNGFFFSVYGFGTITVIVPARRRRQRADIALSWKRDRRVTRQDARESQYAAIDDNCVATTVIDV